MTFANIFSTFTFKQLEEIVDLLVLNEVINSVYDGMDQQFVNRDGHVLAWSTFATVKLSCLFDATYFPNDKQTCSIVFSPFITAYTQYNLSE